MFVKDLPGYSPGDRVRIRDPHFPTFWANGATGTIAVPPESLRALSGGWVNHIRHVATMSGIQPYYWLQLDEARLDGDGDGPYREAEIAGASIHPLLASSAPEA
jgi:hypothetical protein